MLIARAIAGISSASLLVLGTGLACAQTTSTGSGQAFPNKTIRIVTGEPGGSTDLVSRLTAQGLTESLAQQVIVENRGGNTYNEATIVARAPPDGYTLLVVSNSFWILPLLQTVPFNPLRDYAAISLTHMAPAILVVTPALPVNSVKELIALAKAKPGELNYASGSTGSVNHLAAELLKYMAGVNIVRIPYKGTAPALIDVIAGQVQMMFPSGGGATVHLKSGKLRALAVTSAQPSLLFPGLPTVAASGFPGYELVGMYGIFAPAKTPPATITRLNQEIVRVLNRNDIKEKYLNVGLEVIAGSPAQLANTMRSEMDTLGKMIKNAGIRAD